MAVVLTPDSQKTFFKQTFGQQWTDKHIAPLINMGATIQTEFTQIKVKYNGLTDSISLPVNISAIMKGSGNPEFVSKAKADIQDFIAKFTTSILSDQLQKNLEKAVADAAPVTYTPEGIETLSQQLQKNIAQASVMPPNLIAGGAASPPVGFKTGGAGGGGAGGFGGVGGAGGGGWPSGVMAVGHGGGASGANTPFEVKIVQKPVDMSDEDIANILGKQSSAKPLYKKSLSELASELMGGKKPVAKGIIKLRDAEHVGQKVCGTNPESVYTVMALNKRVKIAVRLVGHGVSIRAEFDQAHNDEKQSLIDLGMTQKGPDYYSLHCNTLEISPARVVGAFLFDCDIHFDEQIKNLKELQA
jgi:hypothetical protein